MPVFREAFVAYHSCQHTMRRFGINMQICIQEGVHAVSCMSVYGCLYSIIYVNIQGRVCAVFCISVYNEALMQYHAIQHTGRRLYSFVHASIEGLICRVSACQYRGKRFYSVMHASK